LTLVDRLARNPLFGHFSAAHLAQLADNLEERRVAGESFIMRQGEASTDAFLLERGGVRVQRTTPYGQYALAVLGKGDLFGEASFVDQGTRSGDVWTTNTCELVVFPSARLAPLADSDPMFATALYWTFWRSLSAKLRRTNEKITRFFAQGGTPQAGKLDPKRPATGSFRVDMREKRDLFSEQKLSSMEINLLSSLSRERNLRPGEALFHEGDPGDAMYVVLQGRVRISKQIPGAGEEALAILERGDYFGEMALIDRQPRSAEAKAHDADGAVVLSIPKDVVEGLLDIRKVSSVRLLRILCALISKRLREIDDKLVTWYILAGGDVPEVR
jgi:CRP/FNR family cyclic AMP-dependent transcriptional regulator